MNELDNYKYLFLKDIYSALNLYSVEQQLLADRVKPLNIVNNENYALISKYFFLLNNVNITNLSSDQLEKFHFYFSRDINKLSAQELINAKKFIDETYDIILFPKTEDKCVYYGPISDNYICPRDAIVFGLYYDAFGEYKDFELNNKLADIINYIQFDLAKKINKKVAVIPFNQLTLDNLYSNFTK